MKKRLTALLLLAALLLALGPSARAEEAGERTVNISTAAELRQLARDCTLDSFSQGLTVVLTADIDLGEEAFYPIPSFSGVFDGAGHRITNMTTGTDGSHQGLFRYIQAEGTVKDLRLEGTVAPDNSRCQVGGLAGTNYGRVEDCSFSGTVSGLNYVGGLVGENYGVISGCSVAGSVDGKRFTGGVAGYSAGTISGCENDAKVNTGITEGGLELERMDLSSLADLDLTAAEDTDVVSDSGGIVGFSRGSVSGCVNRGTVGYPHYGYNVGGVAGRQSGSMSACENKGTVYGRKDVGGVVGQMEPYMLLKDSASLADELSRLHSLVSAAMGNLTNMNAEIRAVLEEIRRGAESADQDLGGQTTPTPPPAETETPPPSEPGNGSEPGGTDPGGTEPGGTEPSGGEPGGTEPSGTEPADPGANGGGQTENTPAPAPTPGPAPAPQPESTPAPEAGPSSAPAEGGPAETLAARPGRAGGYVLLAAGDPGQEGGGEPGGTEPGGGSGEGSDSPLPDISGALDQLPDISGDLDRLAGGMGDLVSIVGSSSGSLGRDLVAVSDQLSRVLIMMANAMTGDADHRVFEDISEEPAQESAGRVENCANAGAVEGDRNVGGVAGTMGIEYEFDLEGTLAENLGMGSILSSTYQTRCISAGNVNRGRVQAKWDNAGGVAGLQELGLITGCEGYGAVAGGEDGYAGGIVGTAHSAVRGCYAMCAVDGTEYVGGIAGYGSQITGCVSMVSLGEVTACAGAVAGWADMSGDAVSGNLFVHESLGAVDGISYAGRAEPVPFQRLLEREDLPEAFKELKLTFTAQGETVAEIPFTYGGSIDPAQIPPVPPREGSTGSWPDYDYSHLTFSDTLEAVYVDRQAALASAELRDGGPLSLVLLEGDFADGASVSLNAYTGQGPALEEGQVLESWALNLLDGDYAGGRYTVRFLPPETERGSRVELYLRRDGAWSPVQTGRSGSYLTFEAQGETVVFCAVARPDAGAELPVLAGAAGGVLLLAGTALVLRRRRKKKSARPAETET